VSIKGIVKFAPMKDYMLDPESGCQVHESRYLLVIGLNHDAPVAMAASAAVGPCRT